MKHKHDLLPVERVMVDWKPLKWLPWVERREIMANLITPVFFNQYRWSERVKQIGRTVLNMVCPVQTCRVGVSLSVQDTLKDFDWLRDYGRIWEPGSTAFWLEPDTHDQLASWMARYRNRDYGVVVANDAVKIEWAAPIPDPYPTPLADMQEMAYLNSQRYVQDQYLQNRPYNGLLRSRYY